MNGVFWHLLVEKVLECNLSQRESGQIIYVSMVPPSLEASFKHRVRISFLLVELSAWLKANVSTIFSGQREGLNDAIRLPLLPLSVSRVIWTSHTATFLTLTVHFSEILNNTKLIVKFNPEIIYCFSGPSHDTLVSFHSFWTCNKISKNLSKYFQVCISRL